MGGRRRGGVSAAGEGVFGEGCGGALSSLVWCWGAISARFWARQLGPRLFGQSGTGTWPPQKGCQLRVPDPAPDATASLLGYTNITPRSSNPAPPRPRKPTRPRASGGATSSPAPRRPSCRRRSPCRRRWCGYPRLAARCWCLVFMRRLGGRRVLDKRRVGSHEGGLGVDVAWCSLGESRAA